MIVIHICSLFLRELVKFFVQYLQNDRPYTIAMVITYVGLRNEYKGEFDTVNSENKEENSKYFRLSYTHMLGYINLFTSTKLTTMFL
jgi:hypothetical protein